MRGDDVPGVDMWRHGTEVLGAGVVYVILDSAGVVYVILDSAVKGAFQGTEQVVGDLTMTAGASLCLDLALGGYSH